MLTIYEDPVTRQKPEGFARLEKFLSDIGDGYERWKVRFVVPGDRVPMEFEEAAYERIVQP